ncbi:MAG TPA: magnesium/cobalt transporter CorA [Thermomicrobiaceae bacterium]|nr:magnesium/cobalt transporter CorA [Thermomicrobiaceae bacterium]
MIRLELLRHDHSEIESVKAEDISTVISQPDSLLWIDLADPTDADFKMLAQEFDFHPLALEDARKEGQRPKLDQYPTFLFIIFYAVQVISDARAFSTQELALFVGANYLVTIHRQPVPTLEDVATRWRQNAANLHGEGVAILLYSILDTIVDSYFPILDEVAERIDSMEEAIFNRAGKDALQTLFQHRKNLLALRRVIAPERDLTGMLVRRDLELLGPATAVYFQDVYDHVLRVTDALDTYRDLLSGALDAYLSVVSNNLNQVMRTLTAWSIILMSVTLIASIYGMNVALWPANGSVVAGAFSVTMMGAIGAILFVLFKGINWI